ncbi:FAD-dependent oxidoreductase, partial [Thermodesulfobacteriota bacterium]
AETPRNLPASGRDLRGIHFAMEYLSLSNKHVTGDLSEQQLISAAGKNVLVIGGGDTGADCVGTANRQGAKKVYQFEILSKPPAWDKPWNPEWPDWPNILRTSTSHEEGCERRWCVQTTGFEGIDGSVSRARCAEVTWDGSGRLAEVPGSAFSLDVELVLLAMGFTGVSADKLINDLNIRCTDRNVVETDACYMTSQPGVFAAGDAVMGPSLVVRAIYQGREAAKNIDFFLQKHSIKAETTQALLLTEH